MTKEEKQEILKGIVWKKESVQPYGGQHVGVPVPRITLSHPDFDFSISSAEFRSQIKNREVLYTLFELFLDEIGL
jgi:hypothetical protein